MGSWEGFLLAGSSMMRVLTWAWRHLMLVPPCWKAHPSRMVWPQSNCLEFKETKLLIPACWASYWIFKDFQPEKSSMKSSRTVRAVIRRGEGRRGLQAPAAPSGQHQPCQVEAADPVFPWCPNEPACSKCTEQIDPFRQCRLMSIRLRIQMGLTRDRCSAGQCCPYQMFSKPSGSGAFNHW